VTEEAAILEPARRWGLAEIGIALSIVLAVVYGVVVADLGLIMLQNDADQFAFAVLGLFATPLLTTWVAIAIWLASRPLWLRWTVAALLLLVPPLILFGALNA
jgi:hypothetical protein